MAQILDFVPHRGTAARKVQCPGTLVAPILAAVDLGEHSPAALFWACDYADKIGAPLQVLHVLHDPAERPGRYAQHKSDPMEPMVDTAKRMLAEFMAEMRNAHPGLNGLAAAKPYVAKGLPAQTIVNEARRLGASLIVVGCRGKSGLAKFLHGSNAERVTQLSTIPVTVVKASVS